MKILPLSKVLPTKDPGTTVLSQYDLVAYVAGGFVHVWISKQNEPRGEFGALTHGKECDSAINVC